MRRLKAFLLTIASFAGFMGVPYLIGTVVYNLFLHQLTADIEVPMCVLMWCIGFVTIAIAGLLATVFSVVMKEWYVEIGD